jgi:WD40 repeat protein
MAFRKINDVFLDDLFEFIDNLRESGYIIGADQFLYVQEILLKLAADNQLPKDMNKLRLYIAPIICTSPDQQRDFYKRFQEWLYYGCPPIKKTSSLDPKLINPAVKKISRHRKYAILFLCLWTIVIIVSGIIFLNLSDYSEETTGIPKNQLLKPEKKTDLLPHSDPDLQAVDLSQEPIKNPKSEVLFDEIKPQNKRIEKQVNIDYNYIIILSGGILFVIGVWFFRWWRFKYAALYLKHQHTDSDIDMSGFFVKEPEPRLFQSVAFLRTAQKFKKHRKVMSTRIDIKETVRKTVNSGGIFQAVMGFTVEQPEYLVLIDKLTYYDHQAEMMNTLIERLIENEIFVTRYYFDGDPRICYPANKKFIENVNLEQLYVKYPKHQVIIFTNGDYFINTITGATTKWVQKFHEWKNRAILIPDPDHLNQHMESFSHMDFIVMPADDMGMAILIEQWQADNDHPPYLSSKTQQTPIILNLFSTQWVSESEPEKDKIKNLLKQLKLFLDPNGYEWFSACAVYPGLIWHLTLFLGYQLKGKDNNPLYSFERLKRLICLPWFKNGSMPDWLRKILIKEMPLKKEKHIRKVLFQLFLTSNDNPINNFSIEYAVIKKGTTNILSKSFFKRKNLLNMDNSIFSDYIFVSFMGDYLSVRLPKIISIIRPKFIDKPLLSRWNLGLAIISVLAIVILFQLSKPQFLPENTISKPPNPVEISLNKSSLPILHINSGGHMAMIKNIIFTNNGKHLISASNDKTIRVWDIQTGKTVRILRGQIWAGHEGKIYTAALSPNNQLLAVGGYFKNNVIRLIHFPTGQIKHLLKGHDNVILTLNFSQDNKLLISGSADGTARIWDITSGNTLSTLKGDTNAINGVAFSPDNQFSATGSDDSTIKLWRVSDGTLQAILEGHEGKVKSVVFTPDGQYLLSGSDDKTIRLWHGKTGQFIKVLSKQNRGVESLSVSFNEMFVLTGCGMNGNGAFLNHIFSIPSGKSISKFTKHQNLVLSTAISPDNTIAGTGGGNDHEIRLWDIRTGREIKKLVGNGKKVWSVGFSIDGQSICWGNSYEQSNIFDYGHIEHSFIIQSQTDQFGINSEPINETAVTRSVKKVGNISIQTKNNKNQPTFEILKNNNIVHRFTRGFTDGYDHRSLTLTPDGKLVISGGGSGILASYSTQTGQKQNEFIGHTGDVWAVAVSRDGRLLISGSSDQTVRLWEVYTGKLLLTLFYGTDHEWVAWTPEGFFASSENGAKYIGYHLNRGEDQPADFVSVDQVFSMFYRPDLVRYKIMGGYELIITAQLNKIGKIDQVLASGLPPTIEILPHPNAFHKTNVVLEFKIIDVGGGIGKIEYRIDGVLVGTDTDVRQNMSRKSGIIKKDFSMPHGRHIISATIYNKNNNIASQPIITNLTIDDSLLNEPEDNSEIAYSTKGIFRKSGKIRVPFTLKSGNHQVTATVYNKDNTTIASEPITINVPLKNNFDLYILAIGISEYKESALQLKYASNDAISVAQMFKKRGKGLFNQILVTTLLDEEADRNKIYKAFAQLSIKAKVKDVFVLFLAGHGAVFDGTFYFIPQDAVYENSDLFKMMSISGEDLSTLLQRIMALKSLILLDTCHAANLGNNEWLHGAATRSALGNKTALDRLMRKTGRTFLSATSTNQFAIEGFKNHGVFTYAILQGLKGQADINHDGVLTSGELCNFVRNEVPRISKQKWNYLQIPMYNSSGDSFPLGCTEANEGCKMGKDGKDGVREKMGSNLD